MRPGGEDGGEGDGGVGDEVRSAECGVRSLRLCFFSAFRLPPSAFRISTICSGVPAATTLPAAGARFGADVDDPVGSLDDVEVVLDHDDRVAQIDEPVEHVEQLGEVVEVQAGRRLVEQVERAAGVGPGELGGELHALGFAAGERRRRSGRA